MDEWIGTLEILKLRNLSFKLNKDISNLPHLCKALQLTYFIKPIFLVSLQLEIVNVFFRTLIFQIKHNLLREPTPFQVWTKCDVFQVIKIFQMLSYLILIVFTVGPKYLFPMVPRITVLNKVFINHRVIWLDSLPPFV